MTGISRSNGTTAFNAGWTSCLPALGLGLLFASFLSVIERSTAPMSLTVPEGLPGLALVPAVGDAHALFVSSSMAGAVLAGVVAALWLYRWPPNSGERALPGRVLPALQAAFMAFGFAGAISIQLTGGGAVASTLCGLLFGASGLVGAVGWSVLVARSFPDSYALHGSSAIAMAGVLTAVPSLFDGIGTVTYAALLAAAQFALVAAVRRTSRDRLGSAREPAAPGEGKAAGRLPFRDLALSLGGGLLVLLIAGLAWDPRLAGIEGQADALGRLVSAAGTVLVGVAAALVSARCGQERFFSIWCGAVYPFSVVLTLVLPSFGRFAWFVTAAAPVGFAAILVAAWCSTARIAVRAGRRLAPAFMAGYTVSGLAFATGLQLIAVIGGEGQLLCLVLAALYLGILAASFARGGTLMFAPSGASEPKDFAADAEGGAGGRPAVAEQLADRCSAIAADKGLSKRESEVFRYVARGHTQAYIAEQLFISENTVRTHVRRIHAKLGVSSRSELLELVDLPDQTDG